MDSEQISKTFDEIAKLPTISSLAFSSPSCNAISLQYSIRDFDQNNKRRKFETTILIKPDEISETTPMEMSNEVKAKFTSPSMKKTIFLKQISAEGDKPKHFVELWIGSRLEFSIPVSEIHSDFYADSVFGQLAWSAKEDMIAYCPEKSMKGVPKYQFKEDWGELYTGKAEPCLVLIDLKSKEKTVIYLSDLSPSAPFFCGERLYFVGFKNQPRKYGVYACTNRL